MGAEVVEADRAAGRLQRAGLVLGGLADVELGPALVGDPTQGGGEGGQADPLAGSP